MNTDTPRTDEAATCSPSSDTPETDAVEFEVIDDYECGINVVSSCLARKMERERDEARHQLIAMFAREHLTCGWCGEMMHAPPGFAPPITMEKLKTTVRIHLLDCPKHPIRETKKELDELITAARAVVNLWHTPLWKDVPHTAEYINRLRELLPANAE